MRPLSFDGKKRDRWAGILLAALLFRAYVPVGFMPASGAPFLLEMCPASFSASMPVHHSHHQHLRSHGHFETCPFGSAPGAGPASQILGFSPPAEISVSASFPPEFLRPTQRPSRAHQPRGPPSLV